MTIEKLHQGLGSIEAAINEMPCCCPQICIRCRATVAIDATQTAAGNVATHIAALEAERDALRAAREEIVSVNNKGRLVDAAYRVNAIARKALAGKEVGK